MLCSHPQLFVKGKLNYTQYKYSIVYNIIDYQLKVTCLSWEVDWFIGLDECHWLIDSDHDLPDFF